MWWPNSWAATDMNFEAKSPPKLRTLSDQRYISPDGSVQPVWDAEASTSSASPALALITTCSSFPRGSSSILTSTSIRELASFQRSTASTTRHCSSSENDESTYRSNGNSTGPQPAHATTSTAAIEGFMPL